MCLSSFLSFKIICKLNLRTFYIDRYAGEVDIDFVRKAVRSIGRCAIKISSSADKCVETLVELIQTKVSYVVQEVIIVAKVVSCGCCFSPP